MLRKFETIVLLDEKERIKTSFRYFIDFMIKSMKIYLFSHTIQHYDNEFSWTLIHP